MEVAANPGGGRRSKFKAEIKVLRRLAQLESAWCGDQPGAILLRRTGEILYCNKRARQIARISSSGLRVRQGRLRASSPAENGKLQELLAAALPVAGGKGAAGWMCIASARLHPIEDSPANSRLSIYVGPLRHRQRQCSTGQNGLGQAAVALLIDASSTPRVDPALLADALGLSRAQSLVAALLAEGHTVADIAAATHRTEDAVRWHVQQMHTKLGVNRQADLVRLFLTLDGRTRFFRTALP